ncbi:MAG: hypothetical protein QM713_13350 [Arachnia sp.]
MIQVPLETTIREVAHVVLTSADDVLVASRLPAQQGSGARRATPPAHDALPVRQWRNSGPLPRTVVRYVPDYATLRSLGVAQEWLPERAFLVDDVAARPFRPPLMRVGGAELSVARFLAMLPPPPSPRAAAEARVADIRALYGRMLTDVAYRIENAALFDSHVETTRRFEAALALWGDVTRATPDEEVARRGALLAVAFDAARAHAETVGLAHLPAQARDEARRAAAAARLARAATTEAERAAAERQVIRILRSLALYYLPDPDGFPAALPAAPPTTD